MISFINNTKKWETNLIIRKFHFSFVGHDIPQLIIGQEPIPILIKYLQQLSSHFSGTKPCPPPPMMVKIVTWFAPVAARRLFV